MAVSNVADRLYGITFRPQELALYGERVQFDLRYAAMFDDPAEVTERHFSLLVLEITTEIAGDEGLGRAGGRLQLLKCGWELERQASPAQQVDTLPEAPGDVARLLEQIAATVNDLARRAGLEAPLGHEVISSLLHQYRTGGR